MMTTVERQFMIQLFALIEAPDSGLSSGSDCFLKMRFRHNCHILLFNLSLLLGKSVSNRLAFINGT